MQQNEFNPYSPPEARIESWTRSQEEDDTVWRDGKELVVVRGKPLPPRCVKCNAPAPEGMSPRKFHWHAPGWYLMILVGVLIYAIVALIVRKRADHDVALCARHDKRRKGIIYGAVAAFTLGLVLVFMDTDLIGIGVLLSLIGLFGGVLGARILVPTRIDERYTRFRGASKAFLDSLPSLPAHRRR